MIEWLNRSVSARIGGGGRIEQVKHRGIFRLVKLLFWIP